MYKCLKCNKEFKYESEYTRHKNKKRECLTKTKYKCNYCNIDFKYSSKLAEHEKTKKHIINSIHINGDHNHVENHIGDINNIINLTLQTKSFDNTDLTYLKRWIVNDIGDNLYLKIMKKTYLEDKDKVLLLFRGVVDILEHLHFNLNNENNHNLKILLMFPGFKKPLYEYLILEIDPETNNITWNSLNYKDFVNVLFKYLENINEMVNNKNFKDYLDYLKSQLVDDEDNSLKIKPYIEEQLNDLYTNFNKQQKKTPREIKLTIEEKIKEYRDYRSGETRLHNGFNPQIINSQI